MKNLLAILLSVCLMVSVLPIGAYAAEEDAEFHIQGIQEMKEIISEDQDVPVKDITIHGVEVHGLKDGKKVVATGDVKNHGYDNKADIGDQKTNGQLTKWEEWDNRENKDKKEHWDNWWMVANKKETIEAGSISAITIYAKTGTDKDGLGGKELKPVTIDRDENEVHIVTKTVSGKALTEITLEEPVVRTHQTSNSHSEDKSEPEDKPEEKLVTFTADYRYDGLSKNLKDFTMTEGVHKYSELASGVPAGYTMAVAGDFYAKQGTTVVVDLDKVETEVIMNIRFMDGDTFVAGGDYFVPAGVQNYSILNEYVPEGYKMSVAGDFMAEDGAKLDVPVEKINKEIIMNIRFMDGDTFVAGGDYFVPAGVQNYSVLEKYVPEGYKMSVAGDFMAVDGAKLDVPVEKINKEIIMNIRFMDGDTFVAGGDYFVPAGVQNYSVLEKYVPEGYKMSVAGDFMAVDGAKLDVPVEKINKEVIMNILFVNNEDVIAGGDYFVPAGVQNYSVLEKYVPEGYKMSVAGDFMAEGGAKLDVPVEKINKEVIMNIRFMDGDTFVAGGDYFVPAGVQNYSVLEKYVPEGYKMSVAGDFMAEDGAKLDVPVEKINKEVVMNILFVDNEDVIAGGDYFVPAGVQNYSVLEKYVPEGYKMSVAGDFMAEDGAKLDVPVEKINKEVVMNILFVDNEDVIAGGDYFVPAGVQNYSVLEKYVPEGYKMSVAGDFTAADGTKLDVPVEKINKNIVMNIRFMDGKEFVAGGDYSIPAGTQKYSILEQYVPEGYKMSVAGDFTAAEGAKLDVPVEKMTKTVGLNFWDVVNNKQVKEVPMKVDADATEVWTGDITPPDGYWFVSSGKLAICDGYVYVAVKPAEKPTKTVGLNFYDEVNNKPLPEGAVNVPSDATHVNISMITPPAGYEFTETGDLKINDGYVYVGVKPIEPPVEMVTFKVNYVNNSTGRSVGDAEKADEEVVAEAEVTDEIVAAANSIVVEENKEASHPANGEVKAEESKETAETTVTDNETAEAPASGNTASAADKESSVPENAEGKAEDPKETAETAVTDNQTAETPATSNTDQSADKDSQVKSDNTPKSEKTEEKNIVQTILDKVLGKK